MTFKRKKRIVTIHAASVINHPNQRDSSAPNQDFDLASPGVDTVLD
jgi:hypothetical protein